MRRKDREVGMLAGGAKAILEDSGCALCVSTTLNKGHCCVKRKWFPHECISRGHDK
jgi:acyl-coenzyme A thioesterase PaaI-like protein